MEGTIGEIRLFAATFAPRNWAYCNGQIMTIASNTALFSILGTTFGGDGKVNFALPQLAGRTAIGNGAGPGIDPVALGKKGGASQVTLTQANLAPHLHVITASVAIPAYADTGDVAIPANNTVIASKVSTYQAENDTLLNSFNSSVQVTSQGGSAPVNIVQPSIGMNYVICLVGDYPQRS